MKRVFYLLVTGMLLMLSGCVGEKEPLSVLSMAPNEKLTATQVGVPEFLEQNKDYHSEFTNDVCSNITPDFIRENTDLQIFKYSESFASFLLYEGTVYPLGQWFGGIGLTSLALADLNTDGTYELYHVSSSGSGVQRCMLGYFDPATKKMVTFPYMYFGNIIFYTETDGALTLTVQKYDIEHLDASEKPTLLSENLAADVLFRDGSIQLDISAYEDLEECWIYTPDIG